MWGRAGVGVRRRFDSYVARSPPIGSEPPRRAALPRVSSRSVCAWTGLANADDVGSRWIERRNDSFGVRVRGVERERSCLCRPSSYSVVDFIRCARLWVSRLYLEHRQRKRRTEKKKSNREKWPQFECGNSRPANVRSASSFELLVGVFRHFQLRKCKLIREILVTVSIWTRDLPRLTKNPPLNTVCRIYSDSFVKWTPCDHRSYCISTCISMVVPLSEIRAIIVSRR